MSADGDSNQTQDADSDERLPDVTGYLLPGTEPYDPEPRREQLRGVLAVAVVALLGGVTLLAFLTVWLGLASPAEVKDLVSTLFPPLVALAGSALGFYFGARPT